MFGSCHPNISGKPNFNGLCNYSPSAPLSVGPFTLTKGGVNKAYFAESVSGWITLDALDFNAANSASIYGKATTVQPIACQTLIIIKT